MSGNKKLNEEESTFTSCKWTLTECHLFEEVSQQVAVHLGRVTNNSAGGAEGAKTHSRCTVHGLACVPAKGAKTLKKYVRSMRVK